MRQRKHERNHKRQLGQFMTPRPLARDIVASLPAHRYSRILEPACGDGAFLAAIIEQVADNHRMGNSNEHTKLIGIEIDPVLAEKSRTLIEKLPKKTNTYFSTVVHKADFFHAYLNRKLRDNSRESNSCLQNESFDLIIGNPPFGGTFDHSIEDILDRSIGKRLSLKIKKETYAFFIVACLDLLSPGGRLVFICSNSLLTIPTMTGLRHLLMEQGEVSLRDIDQFSDETTYPMLLLDFTKSERRGRVKHNSTIIKEQAIRSTPNFSWGIRPEFANLFSGSLLGDYFVASSGMTTGKNELFVREVDAKNRIVEPYHFEFYEAPISVEYELARARLGTLSARKKRLLQQAEERGDTERRLRVIKRDRPLVIQLPDSKYRPYNKANGQLVFSAPTHYIFWEDEGDAVLTYKKTGNWYLRGVGGRPFFGREGLTWQLVASRFVPRYLPEGYILDSGAPCAFPRDEVPKEELLFVLGWLLSQLANKVLKSVINHTRNIQSKDFERMPYPWWVTQENRTSAINLVVTMIKDVECGRLWSWKDQEFGKLDKIFEAPLEDKEPPKLPANTVQQTLNLHNSHDRIAAYGLG